MPYTDACMKIGLVANTDWYLFGYRKPLAAALLRAGHSVVLLSPRGQYAPRLVAEGYNWQELDFSRKGTNPLRGLLDIVGFWQTYRREHFDVVHHFTMKAVIYGSIAAKLLSTPVIVNSITGLGSVFTSTALSMRVLRKLVIALYRWALKGTRVVFQNSADMEYMIQARLVVPERAHLIKGSGVDVSSFSHEPEPTSLPIVLLASRMLWEKGVKEFVDAARQLNQTERIAQFVLVGAPDPGNPSSISEHQLQTWSEAGDVTWLGWRDDMPAVIKSASIICFPSFYGEGLPKILLEAGAAGRPVVASDIPACREIISHQVNGLLVPPRDVDALVKALRALIEDAPLRQRMGQAGREIVSNGFTIEQINKATMVLYDSHLS
jgi:glycosyltransferase involved in cell wall biosynthesis